MSVAVGLLAGDYRGARSPYDRIAGVEDVRSARARRLVCLAVFVLLSMPRARLMLGGVPIYFLDVLALVGYWSCWRARMLRVGVIRSPWIGGLMLIMAFSQAQHVLLGGDEANAIYMFARYSCAVVLQASVAGICRAEGGVWAILNALAWGAGLTGLLSVASSVPGLKTVATLLLSNPLLNPTDDKAASLLELAGAARGISLVGTSTITAAFLAATWPLTLVLARSTSDRGRWRSSWLLSMIVLFGALATYSRGGVLAVAGSSLVMALAGARLELKRAMGALIALGLVVGLAGLNSERLLVSRLIDRTQILVEAIESREVTTDNERERFDSWVEPFLAIGEDPMLIVVGYGNSRGHSEGVSRQVFRRHSGLASGIFYFGLLAALLFHWVIIRTVWFSLQGARKALGQNRGLAAGVAGSVAAVVVWLLLGHAGISTPRGFALILVLLALFSPRETGRSGGAFRSGQICRGPEMKRPDGGVWCLGV